MKILIQVSGTKETLTQNIQNALVQLKQQLPGFEHKSIKVLLNEVKK